MTDDAGTTRQLWVAVLLFESSTGTPGYRPLYREDITLVHARSEAEARERAERHGREQESTTVNDLGERVTLSLRTVVDVAPALTDRFDDDADVYSRHFRDITAYEAFEPLLSGEEL